MKSVAILLTLLAVVTLSACDQFKARTVGGTETVTLEPGLKLEMVTWKQNDLWICTRTRMPDEKPQTHRFSERSLMGVLQGTVVIVER